MRYLSVCSGIEAATSAWHHLGWEPVAFSEIEPFPSAVLKHHYPNVPNWGDMTQYKTWPDATIDLLVGGTPCQSFSVAGLRKGLEDPRGNLMLTFLGIAQRYRPKYIVWENVPGVLSSNGGKDFGSFLAALGELGYGWAYRVLDAQWFGVAQRRRRVFVVGCLGDQRRAAQVLFESESVRRDTPPSRAKGQEVAATIAARFGVSRNNHEELAWDENGIQRTVGTLCADTHPGAYSGQDAYSGRLVPNAFKVRGGCEGGGKGYLGSDDTAFTVATHQDQQIAQPVAFAPADIGPCIGSSGPPYSRTGNERVETEALAITFQPVISPTITTCKGSKAGSSSVAQPVAFHPTQDPISSTDVCHAIGANDNATAAGAFKSGQGAASRSIGWDENVSPTLPANAGGNTAPAVIGTMTSMQVRRLTPVECERLQGFPDSWTNIPWRGKAEAPDGPRYKALGNSMAVPVMRWIGERINA